MKRILTLHRSGIEPSTEEPQLQLEFRSVLRVALIFLFLLANACGPVRLVSPYDPAIDKGMTAYYERMDAFLSEMARLSADDDPEGSYSENVTFYEENGAKVDSLIMRAKAAEPKASCIGSDAIGALAQRLLSLKPVATGIQSIDIDAVVAGLKDGAGGSCTAQVLSVVKANHVITAAIHERNDKLTAPVVAIIKPPIEQGVRIAVTTELAKKRGEE